MHYIFGFFAGFFPFNFYTLLLIFRYSMIINTMKAKRKGFGINNCLIKAAIRAGLIIVIVLSQSGRVNKICKN